MPAPRMSPRMKKVSIGRVITRLSRVSSGSSMLVTWPAAPGGGRSSGSRSMLSVMLDHLQRGYPPDKRATGRTLARTQDRAKREGFDLLVVTARLAPPVIVRPGSRRTLAIGTTYPRRSRADDDDRFPRQAGPKPGRRRAEDICPPPPRHRVVRVATRTGRLGTRQGVWSDPRVQPRPPPPHPPGAGVGPAHLTRPRRQERGQGGNDHGRAGELARGAEVEGT